MSSKQKTFEQLFIQSIDALNDSRVITPKGYIQSLNNYCKELVFNSMYPVHVANKDTGTIPILKIKFKEPQEVLDPYTIAKTNSSYESTSPQTKLTLEILKKAYSLQVCPMQIEPFESIEQNMLRILNNTDMNFIHDYLYEYGRKNTLLHDKGYNTILSINRCCNLIASRTRRGRGNNILISNNVYMKIKDNIIHEKQNRYIDTINNDNDINDEKYFYGGRNVEYIGDLKDINVKVYLNKVPKSDREPIFIWYSGNQTGDNPYIYVTKDEGQLDLKNNHINNTYCFINNDTPGTIDCSDYVSMISFE